MDLLLNKEADKTPMHSPLGLASFVVCCSKVLNNQQAPSLM